MFPHELLLQIVVGNLISLLLIFAAWRWPNAARWFLAVFFIASSLVNTYFALTNPTIYVEGTSQTALLPFYRAFITGVFSRYAASFILLIALGQLVSGVLSALGGRYLPFGAAGMIVFLLAILPLGAFSAFPATLLWAVAAFLTANKLRFQRFHQSLRSSL